VFHVERDMADSPTTLLTFWTEQLDRAVAGQVGDEAKREFLSYAWRRSEQRYSDFVTGKLSDAPHPIYGRPTATDFLLFLGEISKRQAARQFENTEIA
jgi:hypothetical protein